MRFALRPAAPDDVEDLVEIRAVVMRPDLERLGRYDAHRVRQRLRDGFSPEHTQIIEVGGELAGSIAVRPAEDRRWLEHFYLAPQHQGQGLGTQVLQTVLGSIDGTVWLNVLQGSPARKLYERHGFVVDSEDPVDVFMVRKFL
ncbi:GNAT family N-acetyltransferase [Kribbella jiaozuonensis]|uniref:GNAT family N-acetyltransferase n=1 Tax=Kribbella jiaozuonensis TaxID=2575441 RepID=A0A4V5UWS9_9ACTN|nr:GNAT family N-acetyltransferase [Kribbella jiaozuonensis]TKK78073.1 GNAT family N-acetyltransferase [Kribbella jiaozuonensis]